MPRIHRRLKKLLRNWWSWVIDYWYVVFWQLHSIAIADNPRRYRQTSSHKPSIILIPGIYENWRFMRPVTTFLYEHGYDVHVVEKLGFNVGEVEQMARLVEEYIERHELKNCVIVAHSKGGLVGKQVLTQQKADIVKGMVAINSPFNGSRYALFVPLRALKIFVPDSPLLTTLSANALVNQRIVSIYGTFDPHIPGGSELKGAENVKLDVRGHFRVLKARSVHQALLASIEKFSDV